MSRARRQRQKSAGSTRALLCLPPDERLRLGRHRRARRRSPPEDVRHRPSRPNDGLRHSSAGRSIWPDGKVRESRIGPRRNSPRRREGSSASGTATGTRRLLCRGGGKRCSNTICGPQFGGALVRGREGRREFVFEPNAADAGEGRRRADGLRVRPGLRFQRAGDSSTRRPSTMWPRSSCRTACPPASTATGCLPDLGYLTPHLTPASRRVLACHAAIPREFVSVRGHKNWNTF